VAASIGDSAFTKLLRSCIVADVARTVTSHELC